MHEFWCIGVIVDIDYDALPFLEAQQRSRELAVVKRRGNDVIRGKFDKASTDTQGVVGVVASIVGSSPHKARRHRCDRAETRGLEQRTTTGRHDLSPPHGSRRSERPHTQLYLGPDRERCMATKRSHAICFALSRISGRTLRACSTASSTAAP